MQTNSWKTTVAAVAITVAAAAGCASMGADKGPAPAGIVGEDMAEASNVVVAVNRDTREVTVEGPDGLRQVIQCGPEVRNFDQIEVGDHVLARYYRSLTYQVQRKGTAEADQSIVQGVGRSVPGAKPGVVMGGTASLTATIVAINKSAGTVTLRNAEGREETITPRDQSNLDRVSVGDLVTFEYTELVAITVEEIQ
jgi:hypothetical protein